MIGEEGRVGLVRTRGHAAGLTAESFQVKSRLSLALAMGSLGLRSFLCEAGVISLGEFHSALLPAPRPVTLRHTVEVPWAQFPRRQNGTTPALPHTLPEALPPHPTGDAGSRGRGSEAGTQLHLLPRGRV